MSSLEVADAAPVVADLKAEIPAIDSEVTQCDDSERANDKAPETPVTEPLTNGSSAPETPKDEIRQNGDAASIEEQAVVAEKVPEVEAKVPEPANHEEQPEVANVDSIPMNGLKIEESVQEEVKPPVEVEVPPPTVVAEKIEEVVSVAEKAPEPSEEKAAVVADAEVCVEKESSEAAGNVEVAPPPLPACPPPSSFTVFAESTMAPLVDTQNVANLPVVDVEASLTPVPSLAPATQPKDDLQSTQSESNAPLVCQINPVTNLPTALPNDNALEDQLPPPPVPSEILAETSDVPTSDANIPSLDAIVPTPISNEDTKISELPPSVENVAVVSPNEIIVPAPEILETSALIPPTDIPSNQSEVVEEIIQTLELGSVQSSPAIPETSDLPAEISPTIESVPPPSDDLPLPQIDELSTNAVSAIINDNVDSPVLPRALSDLDISETTNAEPPSDSFPPPPPPESCPESMTEFSVSESLPPPLSETSLPDTVVNSPTSEIVDLPPKEDVPQNVEIPEVSNSQEQDVQVKEEPAPVETKASPVTEPSGDAPAVDAPQPAEAPQVVNESAAVEVPAVEQPAPEVPAPTEVAASE